MDTRIVELTPERLPDMNKANEPFEIIGRVCPALSDGQWTYAEALDAIPTEKLYPVDDVDYRAYIGSPDRIVYLAYDGDTCVGQIVLRRDWNRCAFIEDSASPEPRGDRALGRPSCVPRSPGPGRPVCAVWPSKPRIPTSGPAASTGSRASDSAA